MEENYLKGDALYWWSNILTKSDREDLILRLYTASMEEVSDDEEKKE